MLTIRNIILIEFNNQYTFKFNTYEKTKEFDFRIKVLRTNIKDNYKIDMTYGTENLSLENENDIQIFKHAKDSSSKLTIKISSSSSTELEKKGSLKKKHQPIESSEREVKFYPSYFESEKGLEYLKEHPHQKYVELKEKNKQASNTNKEIDNITQAQNLLERSLGETTDTLKASAAIAKIINDLDIILVEGAKLGGLAAGSIQQAESYYHQIEELQAAIQNGTAGNRKDKKSIAHAGTQAIISLSGSLLEIASAIG